MTANTSAQSESVPSPRTLGADVSTEIEPNILDNYENPTYHFKLYMMSPGAVAAREFGNNSSAERIVIAESGVSPVGIDDVEITTTGSISKEAGTGIATRFSFTLMEPFGVTLIDQIQRAAYYLGISNFQKFPMYLELTFKARKFGGETINTGNYSPENDPAQRKFAFDDPLKNMTWTWPIQLVNMAMNVTTGGTVYALEAVPFAEHAYTNESSDLEEAVNIEASTVGEFFDGLQAALNKREADKTETSQYIQNDQYQFFLDEDIYKAKIVPLTEQEKENRAATYKEKGDKMVFAFQAGTSIDKIVRNILTLTPYFQKDVLSTDDPDSPGQSQQNERAIYQKLWRVVADTDVGGYDTNRNDYQKIFKYLIIPWTATTVQSPSNMTAVATDQERVDSHRRRGLIKKVYNYIYTGLNDQVFDFELNFNFNWYVALPIQGGLTTIASRKEPKGAMTPEQKEKTNKWAKKYDDLSSFVANPLGFAPLSQLEDWLNGNISGVTDSFTPAVNSINDAALSVNDVIGDANTAAQSVLDTTQNGMPVVPGAIGGIVQNPLSPFISGASTTLNNLTSFTKIPRIDPAANINVTNKAQANLRSLDLQLDFGNFTGNVEEANDKILASITEAQAGKESSDGQDFAASPGQTLLSAMFEQAESPVSADLLNIDLNIKGDPYWLEPGPTRRGTAPTSQFRRLMANRGVDPDATQDAAAQTNTSPDEINEVSVANTAERETLMVFRSYTPQEFDPVTGLTPAGKKSSNVLNGIYAVRMVYHSFSGGEFKQRLQGIRDINTNLRNVDLFSELRDVPEDTAESSESPPASTDTGLNTGVDALDFGIAAIQQGGVDLTQNPLGAWTGVNTFPSGQITPPIYTAPNINIPSVGSSVRIGTPTNPNTSTTSAPRRRTSSPSRRGGESSSTSRGSGAFTRSNNSTDSQ